MTVRRWTGTERRSGDGLPYALTLAPPHTLWQSVAAMAAVSAAYRYMGVPLLGKRQARQWLRELGQRRQETV